MAYGNTLKNSPFIQANREKNKALLNKLRVQNEAQKVIAGETDLNTIKRAGGTYYEDIVTELEKKGYTPQQVIEKNLPVQIKSTGDILKDTIDEFKNLPKQKKYLIYGGAGVLLYLILK